MPIDTTMKVLVIDDFESSALMLKSQLKKLGFTHIEVATGGAEALARLRAAKDYRLIMSDWAMDSVDGLQVLQWVRSDDRLRGAKFLMVTGNTNAKDVAAARAAGVSGYVIKPYNIAMLKQRVEAAFGY